MRLAKAIINILKGPKDKVKASASLLKSLKKSNGNLDRVSKTCRFHADISLDPRERLQVPKTMKSRKALKKAFQRSKLILFK